MFSANRPRPALVLDLSTSLAIGAIPASTEVEDENDDEDDDDSGATNTALTTYERFVSDAGRGKRLKCERDPPLTS